MKRLNMLLGCDNSKFYLAYDDKRNCRDHKIKHVLVYVRLVQKNEDSVYLFSWIAVNNMIPIV